jgi:hypothetical protein
MEPAEVPLVTREEARASLEEIDRIILQTRRTIARGSPSPIMIMWGIIWMIGFATEQFFPGVPHWFWGALDLGGIAGSVFFGRWFRTTPLKSPHHARIGLSWLILFFFGFLWVSLLGPWDLAHAGQIYGPWLDRKIAAFWCTVPMFAYIILGIWLDRFLVWLGALVVVATLVGYYFISDYFFLWLAVTGGGALVTGGILIRKFWK